MGCQKNKGGVKKTRWGVKKTRAPIKSCATCDISCPCPPLLWRSPPPLPITHNATRCFRWHSTLPGEREYFYKWKNMQSPFFDLCCRMVSASLQSRAPFADLIYQKCPTIFNDFYVKSSSRYSLLHILSASSSKSAPRTSAFFGFMWSTIYILDNDAAGIWLRALDLVCLLPTSSSKSAPRPSVFHDLYVKSRSRYSLVRLLPTSSAKSSPRPSVFHDLYVKSRSRYSAPFADLIYQKCSEPDSFFRFLCEIELKGARQFFTNFMWNRALATVSCTFCRPHLPKAPVF